MTGSSPEYERFPKDPIVEAILALDVAAPTPLDASLIGEFHEAIRTEYPDRAEPLELASQFDFSATGRSMAQSVAQRTVGYEFRSVDGQTVIRVLERGFSFHHLRPYPGWSTFREQARSAWGIYRRIFSPEKIERIGLRYLDRIELPLPFADLKEFLRTYPEVAPSIDTGFASYLLRLVFPDADIPAVGRITQAIEPVRADVGFVPLVFDVDVSRQGEFPTDERLVWDTLDRLRHFKNRLFFESITEQAKDLFR